DAGAAQGHEFRNCVILAVAAARERRQRRGPDVEPAILHQIADRPDGKVDGTVDLAEPGSPLAGPGGIDDGEELQRSRGCTTLTVALAQGELHHFVVKAALHAEPFVKQYAVQAHRGA